MSELYNKPIFRYRVLIFDDDPTFLNTLENELYRIIDNKNYDIYIEKTTSSRYALQLAEEHLFDAFVLDICSRKYNGKTAYDLFDYQGQDLYNNLLDKHPKIQYRSKFIVLSNLKPEQSRNIFGNKEAEYFYKQNTNCENLAMYLKVYFDEKFKNDYSNINEVSTGNERSKNKSFGNNYHININGKTENVQINLSNDNSTINASQKNSFTNKDIENLIEALYENTHDLSDNESRIINENIELIKSELSNISPKKTVLQKITTALSAIKGSAEFIAATAAITEYIQHL